MIIYMKDARQMGYCASGVRAMARRHGLDLGAFLRDGIDAEALLATGDAQAVALVEAVHGRAASCEPEKGGV